MYKLLSPGETIQGKEQKNLLDHLFAIILFYYTRCIISLVQEWDFAPMFSILDFP